MPELRHNIKSLLLLFHFKGTLLAKVQNLRLYLTDFNEANNWAPQELPTFSRSDT